MLDEHSVVWCDIYLSHWGSQIFSGLWYTLFLVFFFMKSFGIFSKISWKKTRHHGPYICYAEFLLDEKTKKKNHFLLGWCRLMEILIKVLMQDRVFYSYIFHRESKKDFFLFHQDILLGISDIHSEIFGKKKRKRGYSQ